MINIDFKIILDSEGSQTNREIPIQDVDPQELLEWLCKPDNYLKGGYCISVANEAWKGYWNEKTKSYSYYIEHIDGAINFLKALHHFNSDKVKIGDTRGDLWPCDGSALEISSFAEEAICLKDEVFGCEEMITSVPYFSFLFQEATDKFIAKLSQVLKLSLNNEELQTGLNYLITQAKKYSITIKPELSAIFSQLSGSVKIPL